MHRVSIVIPALNEGESIGGVLDEIADISDEILVVDGYSKDKTVGEAKKRGAKVLFDNIGKGSALRKGFEEASGDIVVMMDADGSHSKEEVLEVIAKIKGGYDVCMPSRFMAGGGSQDITGLRRVGNNFYKFWVKLLWNVYYTDICYGFRGFSKKALEKLDLKADGFDIEAEIAIKTAKRRLRHVEIPSIEKKRVMAAENSPSGPA